MKHILDAIDVFSKYRQKVPLKNKTAVTNAEPFEEIFPEGREPVKF